MTETKLNYGIPDINLALSSGGRINPSCLAGHQLVVLFLPEESSQQLTEIESYKKFFDELSGSDAWLVAIADRPPDSERSMPIALDPAGEAWRAFQQVADDSKLDRANGAVFFFTRGGAFHRAWAGRGHAADVIAELTSREA